MFYSSLKPGKGFKPRKARLSPSAARLRTAGNYGGLKSKRLRKVGRNSHSQDWRKVWRKIKPKLASMGIDCCEECGSRYFLTPAHSLKRRFIQSEEDMSEVAILCLEHHRKADEEMSHSQMYDYIRGLIAKRPERCLEAA